MGISASTALESVYVLRPDVPPAAITRSLQALLPTRHHPIARHRFTVLDTFDGRVRRAGGRLSRVGVNGMATVAWQRRGAEARLVVSVQEPFGFAWDLPDGPLRRMLTPVVGPRRLLAQADAEHSGSLLEILDDRGKTIARVRIESGRTRLPVGRSPWQLLPTMITLTGLRGYEEDYERLLPVIESRPGIEPHPDAFYGLKLQQTGASTLERISAASLKLAPMVRADDGARQIHLALLGILEANEPGLRARLDTEFLHDFRVAVRRTRSLLGQVRHVFPPEAVAHFSTEFSWLGSVTGPPRDIDVLVLSIRAHPENIGADDIDPLMAFLGQVQNREHLVLIDALDSDRYRQLLAEWKRFLERPAAPESEPANAGCSLVDVVARRAWRLSRRIAASAELIDEHTPAERLHQVRIDAKKLRYLVDVTPGFYDAADLAIILRALKNLQSVLGDLNDAQVQEQRLLDFTRALSAVGGSRETLLALGRLAALRRQDGKRLRSQVLEGLARFRATKEQSACRRAFQRAGASEPVR